MSLDMNKIKEQMEKGIEHLHHELGKISTGRANPSLVDGVSVVAYGSPTPLNQVALINVPEARQLTIKPFDPSLLKDVETAINAANLGLNPSNDGEIIRINIAPLTEETRKKLTKEVKSLGEEAKVRVRNVRQDAMNSIKKDEELTTDDKKNLEAQVQSIVTEFNKQIETIITKKEEEVMTI